MKRDFAERPFNESISKLQHLLNSIEIVNQAGTLLDMSSQSAFKRVCKDIFYQVFPIIGKTLRLYGALPKPIRYSMWDEFEVYQSAVKDFYEYIKLCRSSKRNLQKNPFDPSGYDDHFGESLV